MNMITKLITTIAAASLGLAAATQASVTVTWAQDGPDVTATWSGHITLIDKDVTPVNLTTVDGTELGKDRLGLFESAGFDLLLSSGDYNLIDLPDVQENYVSGETWGWYSLHFAWRDDQVTESYTSGNAKVITYTGGPADTLTFKNTTLAAMGVDQFINKPTVAWTTNHTAGDTITYTAVPEPSSAALLGLGGLALIMRRRK